MIVAFKLFTKCEAWMIIAIGDMLDLLRFKECRILGAILSVL